MTIFLSELLTSRTSWMTLIDVSANTPPKHMHSLAGIRSINAWAASQANKQAPEPTDKQRKNAAVKESLNRAAKGGCVGVRAGDWENR